MNSDASFHSSSISLFLSAFSLSIFKENTSSNIKQIIEYDKKIRLACDEVKGIKVLYVALFCLVQSRMLYIEYGDSVADERRDTDDRKDGKVGT